MRIKSNDSNKVTWTTVKSECGSRIFVRNQFFDETTNIGGNMPLELMHEEMVRQLMENLATIEQVNAYNSTWSHAMTNPGVPLPCPICFLSGETNRLLAISEENGLGIVRCESCRNEFKYEIPDTN